MTTRSLSVGVPPDEAADAAPRRCHTNNVEVRPAGFRGRVPLNHMAEEFSFQDSIPVG